MIKMSLEEAIAKVREFIGANRFRDAGVLESALELLIKTAENPTGFTASPDDIIFIKSYSMLKQEDLIAIGKRISDVTGNRIVVLNPNEEIVGKIVI